jgi:hypothetical protein
MELHGAAPEKKDYRQDPKALEEWVEVTYPAIRRKYGGWTKPERVTQAIISEAMRRAGLHRRFLLRQLTYDFGSHKIRYHFYQGKFSQRIYMDFLTRLIKTTDMKVFAIADNCGTHHALPVGERKDKKSASISIFHLPSYAPVLNPTEYLNSNLKRVLLYKGCSKSVPEVKKKAMTVMRSIQSAKNRLESFFHYDL